MVGFVIVGVFVIVFVLGVVLVLVVVTVFAVGQLADPHPGPMDRDSDWHKSYCGRPVVRPGECDGVAGTAR